VFQGIEQNRAVLAILKDFSVRHEAPLSGRGRKDSAVGVSSAQVS